MKISMGERETCETRIVAAMMYALKCGCFFPVSTPRVGATTEELICWGAMRNLHTAVAEFRRGQHG